MKQSYLVLCAKVSLSPLFAVEVLDSVDGFHTSSGLIQSLVSTIFFLLYIFLLCKTLDVGAK
jgi:uncharacterized protein YqhQ